MKVLLLAAVLAVGACCGVLAGTSYGGVHKRVLMTDVKALTLHKGQLTTGRRSAPGVSFDICGCLCSTPFPLAFSLFLL